MKAVITGDIVNSTKIKQASSILKSLEYIKNELANAELIEEDFFDIFRGDSFQLLCKNKEDLLKISIIIRALLKLQGVKIENKLWDARLGLGLGKLDKLSKNLRQSNGEALQYSGRALDKLKLREQLKFQATNNEFSEFINLNLSFVDYIISKWSVESAEVIVPYLLYKERQVEIAKRLGISQPAVSLRLSVAGIDPLEKLIKFYETRC